MKIYTKKGDLGKSLLNNEMISKDEPIFTLLGKIDELQSYLGLLFEYIKDDFILESDFLFNVIAIKYDLLSSVYEKTDLKQDFSLLLEDEIDLMSSKLKKLESFILPIGNKSVAIAHLARTKSRELERVFVRFVNEHNNYFPNGHHLINKYLNRLSDYLFNLARVLGELNWCGIL